MKEKNLHFMIHWKIRCQTFMAFASMLAFGTGLGLAQTPTVELQADGNLLDSAGTNNAVLVDSVTFVPGHSGLAFYPEGGSIRIPNSPDLRPATNLTVQAWVKGTTTASGGTFRYLVSKSRTSSASYALYTASGGGMAFFVEKGATLTVSPQASIAQVWDNNWHQVTGVYDGTNVNLYLDGSLIGATTTTNASTLTYDTNVNNGDVFIGNLNPAIGGANGYQDAIDDVKIFNASMTAAQVADTYSNPSSVSATSGLVAWYQAESNALDSWGNHNGTLLSPASLTYFPGHTGLALLSPKGQVQIPNNDSFSTPTVTVQAWVQSLAPASSTYVMCKAKDGQVSYGLYTGSSGGAQFFVNANTANVLGISATAPVGAVWDGAWHQLTGVYDGANISVYVDGLQYGTNVATNGPIAYSSNFINGNIIIGSDQRFTANFTGLIDDVKVYGQALTPAQILSAFAGSNLVGWWRGESNALDTLGVDNGSTVGSVSYVPGRLNGFAFRTTSGAVVIPNSSSLDLPALSVEASVAASPPGANKYILSKSFTASGASYAFCTAADGGLIFYVTTGSGPVISPEAPASLVWDGSFHEIAGTYDGVAVRLYVDGNQVGSGTPGSGAIQYGVGQSSGELLLGDFADSITTSNFNGIIDEVKLYNNALPATTVLGDAPKSFVITSQPSNVVAVVGGSAAFTVGDLGQTPFTFQWAVNGTNIPGATAGTLTLANVQLTNGGQYTATLATKSVGFTNGPLGTDRAFQFAGGAVDVPNDPSLNQPSVSVQLWVRDATQPGTFRYPFSKSRTTGVSSYALYTGSTGGMIFYINSGTGSSLSLSPSVSSNAIWNGAWHQITGTFADLGTVNLYMDGTNVGGTDSFFGSINYDNGAFAGDLWLGDFAMLSTNFHFPGDVGEVKIFDHELSAGDVADTYANPTGLTATNGLISWYQANGNGQDTEGRNSGKLLPIAGSITSAGVTLTVLMPATLANPQVVGGHFQATVTGAPGSTYVASRSMDLINWTPFQTNAAPYTLTDPLVVTTNSFYRAVLTYP